LSGHDRKFLAGVFLLSMAVLMIQIVQTRILSVVSLYYMAFFSISMAMLGLTGGALIVYYHLKEVTPATICAFLARITTLFALSIVGCFLVQLASPLVTVGWATVVVVWLKAILLLAAPFVVGGIGISLALTRSALPVGLIYGVDLLGAAAGCIASVVLLTVMDAPSAMFMVAAMAAAGGWCFASAASEPIPASSRLNWKALNRPGLAAVLLAVLAAYNASFDLGFQPVSAKGGSIERLNDFNYVKWNSFSRIAVHGAILEPPVLWGASPALPPGPPVVQRELNIDGLASTTMPDYSAVPGAMDFLRYDVTNLAYYARHSGRAAVIGVGGGRDIQAAHLFGFDDITGVELNPVFVNLLTEPSLLRRYAGVADMPGVRFFVDDGRSWFARTNEKFDLIEMSMVDTLAATGVGAFSLSENGLYTVEGWKTFLSALRPDGLLTVSRWHSPKATVEIGRVVSLAIGGLYALGVQTPRDHLYVAGVGNLATVIVSREKMAAADLRALDDAAARLQYSVIVSPDRAVADPVLADLVAARSLDDLNARAVRYFLDVSPPTDARPFFFNQLRLAHPADMLAMLHQAMHDGFDLGVGIVAVGNLIAVGTLLLIVVLSAAVVVCVVLLPARSSVLQVERRLAVGGSAYFLLIGLGFMFVEIGLIQRLSVFLGHPVYALSVGLFGIILSTGLGSLLSERVSVMRPARMAVWLVGLAAYVMLLPKWLPVVTHSPLQAAGLPLRALASTAVIFPAGLLMGFGFPTGMRLVNAIDSRPTPWFWGVNGAAGVLAAGLAVLCSIGFSVDATVEVGGACYGLLTPFALLLLRAPVRAGVPTFRVATAN
jgi:hypothetical protein